MPFKSTPCLDVAVRRAVRDDDQDLLDRSRPGTVEEDLSPRHSDGIRQVRLPAADLQLIDRAQQRSVRSKGAGCGIAPLRLKIPPQAWQEEEEEEDNRIGIYCNQ